MLSKTMARLGLVVLLFGSALVLLVGGRPIAGQDEQDQGPGLAGTWNVTLKFPECSATCPCPGGMPNIRIPALHRYAGEGTITELPGFTLFRGPGLGSWRPLEDNQNQFLAHFKFFLFNGPSQSGAPPLGSRRGSEVVTSHINLTGPDTFDANATYDLFDAAGNVIGQGCPITESGTRLE